MMSSILYFWISQSVERHDLVTVVLGTWRASSSTSWVSSRIFLIRFRTVLDKVKTLERHGWPFLFGMSDLSARCRRPFHPTQVSRPQTFVLENSVLGWYVAPGKSGTAAPAHSYLDMTGSFRRLDGGTRDRVTKFRHQDPSTFAPAEGNRGLLNGEDD